MSFAHFVLDGGGRGRRLRNWAKEHSLSLLMRRTEQNLSLSGQETEGRLCGVKYSDMEGLSLRELQKVFGDLFSRSDAGSNPERRKRAAKLRLKRD